MTIESTIKGVEIKMLRSFPDGRGFFREVFRSTEDIFTNGNFAQWSHSKMQKDVVKAWHYHHKQTDWWYLAIGVADVVLYDNREESPTFKSLMKFKLGDSEIDPEAKAACVRIPPGVLHACQVLSSEAHLFYITSENYDPNDEGRIAYDSPAVPYKWTCAEPIVSEKDRVDFVPKHTRTKLAN